MRKEKREEKKSGVNRSLSSLPVLGHEYLSLLFFFLPQRHLSLHLDDSQGSLCVCFKAMAGHSLKTDTRKYLLYEARKAAFTWTHQLKIKFGGGLNNIFNAALLRCEKC